MTEIMRRIEPLERYSGLLLALLLLFVAAPLNAIVYSTAGVKGTDREDALKTLPAVAAHPVGFVIAGLVFILLGGAVWLFSRAIRNGFPRARRASCASGTRLGCWRQGYSSSTASISVFVCRGSRLASHITLPTRWTPTRSYLEISGALLQAAYVALGGWLFFLCLAMWREKTVSRYLTLLGMFCALVLILAFIADPIIVLLGQFCGFFGRSAWDSGCCDRRVSARSLSPQT